MEDHTHDDASIDLAQFDEAYASAPAEEEDIPDGKYDVVVDKVDITKSRSSGAAMLKWTLRVTDPDYAGRKLWRNNVLLTDENIKWLKIDLKKCGLTLEKLSDLPARRGELLDIPLVVTKKTNGEFTNVYINRRLSESEVTASASPAF